MDSVSAQPGHNIKGACLIEALGWLEKNEGRQALEAALARMPAAGRENIDPSRKSFGLLASEWYAIEHTHVVLDTMTAGKNRAQRSQMARGMAKTVMETTLTGIYGVLFEMMATPERYARYAPRLWAKYYDGGEVHAELPTRTSMIARVSRWDGHHPFLCEVVRFARVSALDAMGCRNVQSELTCKSDVGGEECRTELRWT